jgi:hypothetical protein
MRKDRGQSQRKERAAVMKKPNPRKTKVTRRNQQRNQKRNTKKRKLALKRKEKQRRKKHIKKKLSVNQRNDFLCFHNEKFKLK